MKTKPECVPCYLKQVLSIAREVTSQEEKQLAALDAACRIIPSLNHEASPSENATLALWEAQKVLGESDPFKAKKQEINAELLKVLPDYERQVSSATDPLYTALLFSVAGNIIDLGILPEYDLEQTMAEVLAVEFAINDYVEFTNDLKNACKIVVLGDNAGEIVFDRLLVSELAKHAPVTYVVKGVPILNDATMDDARQVGMAEIAAVITNGSGYLGTVLENVSAELKGELRSADLIISKGQANFETLDQLAAPIYFVLRAKCLCVAEELKVDEGAMVLKKSDCFAPIAQV